MLFRSGTTSVPPANGLIVNGNVGIGTSNPAVILHVNVATDKNFRVENGVSVGAANGVAIRSLNNAASVQQQLSFQGSAILMNPAGGASIGIGTATPQTTLDVNGSYGFPAGRKGTFVCTGAGTITITNSNMLATSNVIISMNAQGGTITTPPAMKTVTAGTGFTVLCGATDTSTYNYVILN